ncbi:glyoxalase-like protein [Azospirillum baldaniorum]|uniref:VOC family protein n=1 Tax=Azospirillum baldaniorum TaxID=1064539 RepID=UPI0011AC2C68|nr:VOC family protein [Azospirillum baldaniorum]TWA57390.1 glyoxalase-like protein [Azospirillum baldaniorum]
MSEAESITAAAITAVGRLDHVGVVVRDLDAGAAAYERLGFQLTPVSRHSGVRAPGRPVEPFGTANRCAMLRHGYIEVIAVVEPALFSNNLERFLDRYEGIHILAFGIDDVEAHLARLKEAGFGVSGIAHLERLLATPLGERLARFSRIPLPAEDAPEGRVQLIRHDTPELLWQPHLLDHPNRVVALEEVVLAVADPEEVLARYARLLGAAPRGNGFRLGGDRFTVVSAAGLEKALPGVSAPALPFVAGIVLRTDDGNAAIGRIVEAVGVPHRRDGQRLIVDPAAAGGAALVFVPEGE